jgi:phosphoglycerol transferase
MMTSSPSSSRIPDWPWWIALFVAVTLLWCVAYNRWTLEAWMTPVAYDGDSLGEMAAAKAFAFDKVYAILPKYPASLGAPFVANWNDYPIVEEGIFAWYGLFVRLFGVFAGSNLTLLSAHLLAAGSFYFVCRYLRYAKAISFVLAILFSMSGYAFARGLWHLVLTFYWNVPLGFLVVWWCLTGQAHADRKKRIACIVMSVLFGVQYIYYTGMYAQFLFLAALVSWLRRDGKPRILFPLFLLGVILATFVLMNVDTFYYRFRNGPNPAALARIYNGVEQYALRPVELLLPMSHRLGAIQSWTNRAYYSQTMFRGGENNSPYLGIVALAALAALAAVSIRAIARGDFAQVPVHAWGIAWILAYSVIGGLNGIIGTFGFVLFRGTNRYSVVILGLALLFLARQMSSFIRRRPVVGATCAGAILVLGLWDQLPGFPARSAIDQVHQKIISDGRITSALEKRLPNHAMIFELPAVSYPEVGPTVNMQDYEHFRPYLQSRSLRFSYGSQKGRTRERWQDELMQLGVSTAVSQLEKFGFAALLINRKGYPDNAASILAELRSAGRTHILCESEDLVAVALEPGPNPLLPPEFDKNWYGLEGTLTDNWRWSSGDAKLIIYNNHSTPRNIHVAFSLGTLRARTVEVFSGANKLYAATLDPAQQPRRADIDIFLRPGTNSLSFRTDQSAEPPGNGDSRNIAFAIRNFEYRD